MPPSVTFIPMWSHQSIHSFKLLATGSSKTDLGEAPMLSTDTLARNR